MRSFDHLRCCRRAMRWRTLVPHLLQPGIHQMAVVTAHSRAPWRRRPCHSCGLHGCVRSITICEMLQRRKSPKQLAGSGRSRALLVQMPRGGLGRCLIGGPWLGQPISIRAAGPKGRKAPFCACTLLAPSHPMAPRWPALAQQALLLAVFIAFAWAECPERSYSVVVDAGSSGTRVVVLAWHPAAVLTSMREEGIEKFQHGIAALPEEEIAPVMRGALAFAGKC